MNPRLKGYINNFLITGIGIAVLYLLDLQSTIMVVGMLCISVIGLIFLELDLKSDKDKRSKGS